VSIRSSSTTRRFLLNANIVSNSSPLSLTSSSSAPLERLMDRPYRAPELFLSTPDPDPFALDAWALGCVIAELFRGMEWVVEGSAGGSRLKGKRQKGSRRRRMRAFSVRVMEESDDTEESESSESEEDLNLVLPAFARRPPPHTSSPGHPDSHSRSHPLPNLDLTPLPSPGQGKGQWTRPPLFHTQRGGEIATLTTIFRVLGRPSRPAVQTGDCQMRGAGGTGADGADGGVRGSEEPVTEDWTVSPRTSHSYSTLQGVMAS